jgi:transcriptional regulator with AAA-type ATPase domain
MEVLGSYPWPGNVRELRNFIERAVILLPGSALRPPLAELKQATVQRLKQATVQRLKQATVQSPSSKLSTLEEAAIRESNCHWWTEWSGGAVGDETDNFGLSNTQAEYPVSSAVMRIAGLRLGIAISTAS